MNCETARDMWMEQDAVYEQKSHSLQQRFYSFNKGEEDSMFKLRNIVQQPSDFGEKPF